MNWKRIGTGTLIATVVLIICEVVAIVLSPYLFQMGEALAFNDVVRMTAYLITPSLGTGFLLTWLYVLARPRLGPGPKTALIMGSIAFFFENPFVLAPSFWASFSKGAALQALMAWIKLVAATYLAGWQYIEKSPE
jgi:hypothetical protein